MIKFSANKPWPNRHAHLYQPYEETQILLPENASCLSVRTLLKMLHLHVSIEPRGNAEFLAPVGKRYKNKKDVLKKSILFFFLLLRTKLPVLRVEGFVVAEFEPILNFVEMRGFSLSKNLDSQDKSDMRAYLCLVEQIFTNAEQYVCWMDKKVLPLTYKRNGNVYPWPLNHYQNWQKRKAVIKQLKICDFANNSMEDVALTVEKCCETLSSKLGTQDFFFGDK